jgi:hypothetical protein
MEAVVAAMDSAEGAGDLVVEASAGAGHLGSPQDSQVEDSLARIAASLAEDLPGDALQAAASMAVTALGIRGMIMGSTGTAWVIHTAIMTPIAVTDMDIPIISGARRT